MKSNTGDRDCVTPIATCAFESTSVSAKFFIPTVWTSLLTGSTILSQVIGLLTVYERFW